MLPNDNDISSLFASFGDACSQEDHFKKKNCCNNPNCLFGLGEFSEGIWKKDGEKKLLRVLDDSAPKVRTDLTKPAGLANLGSTCYLNSILQVMYH
eukprot:gene45383-55526_t